MKRNGSAPIAINIGPSVRSAKMNTVPANTKTGMVEQIESWIASDDICDKAKELLMMALDEIQI